MKMFTNVITLLCAFHYSFSEEVRLLNLDPPEAQQYIDKQDTTLKYAPKVDTNVPAVRFLGNEPHNVLEDIYLANQYHGQDGLGGYLYGYSVPDIAKTERKKAGGDLTGAYNYIAGNGQEIKVQYWDDGTGFHQIDNVPKILPKQIDDTPEVKAAKEEHQRIWNEQAERNSRPIENPFDRNFNYAQGPLSPQGQTQAQQLVTQYQQQRNQFPNPGQNVHYQGDQYPQYQGLPTQNVNKYQPAVGQLSAAGSQSGGVQGSGQVGGSQSSSGQIISGQYGGGQAGSGQLGGGQAASGQLGGGQAASGQLGGGQAPSGQYGGGQSLGGRQSSSSLSSSVSLGGGHASSSGQLGGGQLGSAPSSLGGPFGGSQSSGVGQYGAGQLSGGGQPSISHGSGLSSTSGQSTGSGQLGGGQSVPGHLGSGQASLGGPFGGIQSSAGGQYGAGQLSGGGQPAGGQYGAGLSSSSGQLGGGQASLGGAVGGQSSRGGKYIEGGQYGAGSGQYTGGQISGSYGSGSQYSSQYASQQSEGQYEGGDEGKWNDEAKWNNAEEEKGPPKGFFYSFDYPVGIIVQKSGGPIQKREGDLKDIYSTNKANFEKQVQQGSGSAAGYLAV